uniref:UAS domain-containing protein n=1 Tax=Gongylonema pulchrum TaxID=637853 RepID=A0A183EN07_9BILA
LSREPLTLRRRPPPPQTWFEWAVSILKLPFVIGYETLYELLSFILADPQGDVRRFIDEFNAQFGDADPGIQFFNGSYDDALNECKVSLRFMIVYLHNPSHEACERFVRETLLSQPMKLFLERNDIVLFGVSVRSQEGYKGKIGNEKN